MPAGQVQSKGFLLQTSHKEEGLIQIKSLLKRGADHVLVFYVVVGEEKREFKRLIADVNEIA